MSVIHTIHVIDLDDGRAYRFNDGVFSDGSPTTRDGSILDGIAMMQAADGLIFHNGIAFDIPAIQKLYPHFTYPIDQIHDTLVYTRLLYPHLSEIDAAAIRKRKRPDGFGKLIGSHKLEAWGIRLGENKGDYGEVRKAQGKALGLTGEALTQFVWGDFNPDMEEYAAQDVVVTEKLWKLVIGKNYPTEATRLEHRVAQIIFWQERHGFKFDHTAADALLQTLVGRKAELEDQLRETFRPWFSPVRKGGRVEVFTPKVPNRRHGYEKGHSFTKVKLTSFNPGSRDHIAERMTTLFGWHPVEFTDTGKPKVDETTLAGLDYPEAKLIVDYLTVEKRLGQLAEGKQAWLKAVKADGRVHGRVNTLGAITRRMTHSTPNMAQVPSCGAPYGPECRALFTVEKGRRIVGCDAEGLELRMLAHYMAKYDGGAYAETVINGKQADGTDVHTVNQKVVGLNKRNSAKTYIYAYLYGAGNLKLGTIIYDDMTEERRTLFNAKHPPGPSRDKALATLGNKARKRTEEGLPALGKVQEKVKQLAAKGYLKTLDGGLLRVRSAHAALNTILQGGGAILMKKALVLFIDALLAEGWTVHPLDGVFTSSSGAYLGLVANIHDEFQNETDAEIAEEIGKLAAWAIAEAGRQFNLRCPMAGAYQVGLNWSDSH